MSFLGMFIGIMVTCLLAGIVVGVGLTVMVTESKRSKPEELAQ